MSPRPSDPPWVIAGAGLAGLSLACALLDAGIEQPIVLIDRRTTWERDRTWCTWAVRPTRFAELASHRWSRWRVAAGSGRQAIAESCDHPYICIEPERLYEAALDRLSRAGNVELRAGEIVLDIRTDGARPAVRTRRETLEAAQLFDGLGAGSPLVRRAPRGEVELGQRFLGWEVEVDAPRFDPTVVTLMDFRSSPADELRFLYVLPLSPSRALIEDTSIGRRAIAPAARRAALAAELTDRWGVQEWRVVYEESGHIPMTTRLYPLHSGRHIHAVGLAAGAVRPSSGYAFTRIQTHCDALARTLARGSELPERVAPASVWMLDTIFLHALARDASGFPEVFVRMVERVPADLFARFMTDASSPGDDGRVIALLPKRLFAAGAVRAGLLGAASSPRRAARTLARR